MWVIDLLSNSGFGALIGAVGGYFQKKEERALFKDQCTHTLSMFKAKTEATLQLADKKIESSQVEGDLAVDKVEAEAFQDSVGKANSEYKWVRPVISLYLIALTTYICWYVFDLADGVSTFTSTEIVGLVKLVVLQVLLLTSVAIGWWFAARTSKGFTTMMNKVIK